MFGGGQEAFCIDSPAPTGLQGYLLGIFRLDAHPVQQGNTAFVRPLVRPAFLVVMSSVFHRFVFFLCQNLNSGSVKYTKL